jgi:hypothetical protein
MKLYYTGSANLNGFQKNPDKSLGGFMSENIIPNNSLQNIFSDISILAQRKGYIETKGIILKNTSTSDLTNVYLYHTYPTNCLVKLEWSLATVSSGEMESINDTKDSPYEASFSEPKDVASKILLASSLLKDGLIGLWVRRTILLPVPIDAISNTDLDAYLANLEKEENIVLNFVWD